MSDEFLADIQQEGTSLEEILEPNLDGQVKETPAESPADNNQTESAPSSQGAQEPTDPQKPDNSNTDDANNLPFNKHPAWQRITDQNRELKEAVEKLTAVMGANSSKPEDQKVSVPKEFAELFGENAEAWEKFQKLGALQRSAWEEEQKRQKEEAEQKQKQDAERWQNWVNSSIEKIQEKYNVKLQEKTPEYNEFMAFIKERLPSDENGNIDFVKGWSWYQEVKQIQEKAAVEKTNARKELAVASTSGKKSDSKNTVITSNDLRGKSWHSFIN